MWNFWFLNFSTWKSRKVNSHFWSIIKLGALLRRMWGWKSASSLLIYRWRVRVWVWGWRRGANMKSLNVKRDKAEFDWTRDDRCWANYASRLIIRVFGGRKPRAQSLRNRPLRQFECVDIFHPSHYFNSDIKMFLLLINAFSTVRRIVNGLASLFSSSNSSS